MPDNIRVIVVDDHPLFREGVTNTLRDSPEIDVVGEGTSSEDAIELTREWSPDIALIDVSMAGGGITAAREIAGSFPNTKVIMLTVSEREDDVLGSLRAGASGYILKGVTARELIRIVLSVHAGETYVTPTLAAALLLEWPRGSRREMPPSGQVDDLTERERQILAGLSTGASNKEIAMELDISEKTVKHYMTSILQKLQVRNRVEAALLAQKLAGPSS